MPTVSKTEALNSVLASLSATSGDIEACAVVSVDGLMMASNFPAGLEEDRVGAMAASLLGMSERASKELDRGALQQIFVRGQGGNVVIMAAGPEGVLVVLCSQNAKLGLIFLDMQRAAQELAKII